VLSAGEIVAGYRIEGVLGRGTMAAVYRATDLSRDLPVALKVLAPYLGADPQVQARFEREGRLHAMLDHEHIVTTYAAGDSDHGLFLAMRLIEGPTLKDLIRARELDPVRSVRILAPIADALDSVHAAGLIHRDVKPQNILVAAGDHAYLCDFGLGRASGDSPLTGPGQFLGTIDYVSPEQIQDEQATAAGDCYALAAVLYECLTGEVPFPRPSEAAALFAKIREPPPQVTDRRPDLPAGLDTVIASGMARDPAERPPSATALIEAARRALG
jgi:serine/threonine protein kinase